MRAAGDVAMMARKSHGRGRIPPMSDSILYLPTGRTVGEGRPTFVVAEIGQNHNGSLALAEELVDAAAWAGADAVKVVKRDLGCELTTAAKHRRYDSPHSFGETYGRHREVLELSFDDYAALAQRARSHRLHFVATVCDVPSARGMAQIGVDAFKIASRDLNNLPLLEYVCTLGKPVILSTGMSTWDEIDAAARVMRAAVRQFAVLQCTSLYPTPDEQVHLRSIAALRERYRTVVGFSDHTLGTAIATAAVALGASILEKHLTLDRTLKGTDHACSAEPQELFELVTGVRRVESALGRADKPATGAMAATKRKLGRSVVSRVRIAAGTVLDESMVTLKSPGEGVSWTDRSRLLGRMLLRDIEADELLMPTDVG